MADRETPKETKAGKPDRIDTADRASSCLALRRSGASYVQIAQTLGYSNASGAWKACQKAIAATIHEGVADLRQLEGARLDQLQSVLWPRCLRGDLWAIDRVLSIMRVRARLFGLDAPAKREITVAASLENLA